MKKLITLIFYFYIAITQAQELDNGSIKKDNHDIVKVWNTIEQDWSTIEVFWQRYTLRNQAKSWASGYIYPNYNEVQEFDTFLIQLDQGSCLMQFYHSRWRRANDVRRWNNAFNMHSGCPYVFN